MVSIYDNDLCLPIIVIIWAICYIFMIPMDINSGLLLLLLLFYIWNLDLLLNDGSNIAIIITHLIIDLNCCVYFKVNKTDSQLANCVF